MKTYLFPTLLITSIALTACQSKNSEKSPSAVDASNSGNQIIEQKSFEERLNQISKSLAAIRSNTEAARRILEKEGVVSNNFLDKLAETVAKVQDKIYDLRKTKVLDKGQFKISSALLKAPCDTFDYSLLWPAIGEEDIQYKLGSCYTQKEQLSIISIRESKGTVVYAFNDKNFKKVLPINEVLPNIKGCKYSPQENESLVCESLPLGTSPGMVWTADISKQEITDIRILGKGVKTGQVLWNSKIRIYNDGHIETSGGYTGPKINVE
jgi:hypothetical protein